MGVGRKSARVRGARLPSSTLKARPAPRQVHRQSPSSSDDDRAGLSSKGCFRWRIHGGCLWHARVQGLIRTCPVTPSPVHSLHLACEIMRTDGFATAPVRHTVPCMPPQCRQASPVPSLPFLCPDECKNFLSSFRCDAEGHVTDAGGAFKYMDILVSGAFRQPCHELLMWARTGCSTGAGYTLGPISRI